MSKFGSIKPPKFSSYLKSCSYIGKSTVIHNHATIPKKVVTILPQQLLCIDKFNRCLPKYKVGIISGPGVSTRMLHIRYVHSDNRLQSVKNNETGFQIFKYLMSLIGGSNAIQEFLKKYVLNVYIYGIAFINIKDKMSGQGGIVRRKGMQMPQWIQPLDARSQQNFFKFLEETRTNKVHEEASLKSRLSKFLK